MLDLLIYTGLGLGAGFLTGLSPGLHPNTVIAMLLPVAVTMPLDIVLPLLIGMVVTHSMINHIPAILLGAPDSDSVLAALPGKQLLLDGKAHLAIIHGLNGGLIAMIVAIGLLIIGLFGLEKLYTAWEPYIPYGLSLILVVLVLRGRIGPNSIAVCLTGILGVGTLMMDSISQTFLLFPLLTGLFGASTLIATLQTNPAPDQQIIEETSITHEQARGGGIGALTGMVAGLLPGLGPSATLALLSPLFGSDRDEFMASLGGINTADTVFSLVAIYLIGRARSGAAVAVQQLTAITDQLIIQLAGLCFIVVPTSYLIAMRLVPVILRVYTTIPPKTMIKTVLITLTVFIGVTCGIPGLGVYALATAVGMTADTVGARKSLCMSCLIVPVILFGLGVSL
ncbi:MAG: tripartite tricarboxylate transporter permease [Candidatus Nanohaloarchaeota archaeon QJJ-5]|nr:tripartite tricarboxylate transporter permease [Candidatus Nanohaloarchaeota archaeon QJJ-5]